MAEQTGLDNPPNVEVVRETSPHDYYEAQADCLVAAGYDASVVEGTAITVNPGEANATEEWREQMLLASYVCEAQYPLDEVYMEPLTPEQREAYADYYLKELPDCLAEQGFESETPPSREVFLDGLDSQGPWTPYETAIVPAARWGEVVAACPQSIPPEYLWTDLGD